MNHNLNKIYRQRDSIEYVNERRTGNLLDGMGATVNADAWKKGGRTYKYIFPSWALWDRTATARGGAMLRNKNIMGVRENGKYTSRLSVMILRNTFWVDWDETHMFLPRTRVYITGAANKVYLITIMYWSFLRIFVLAI